MSVKKFFVAGAIVALVGIYHVFNNNDRRVVVVPDLAGNGSAPGAGSVASAGGGTSQTGQYKDGTYTGPVANAFYGNVQVIATVQGGMLTKVGVPIYPNAPGHSSYVSSIAIPALQQEAIQTQSANVNIISGATQTSQAFQESLAAALAQA